MKKALSQWKPCSLSLPHFFSRRLPASCSGKACSSGWTNTAPSSEPGSSFFKETGQEGYLLVFLLPLLLLLLLVLAGSLRVAWKTQNKVALQSRLDICALRMAMERKSTLGLIVTGNQAITLTVLGIYAARGAKAAGPVGAVLGGASEAVLLQMNKSLALLQDTQLRIAGMKELSRLSCESGRFSSETALCMPSPALLKAIRRERTLFPDVKGTLSHQLKGESLASFRCQSGLNMAAAMELKGNGSLMTGGFRDAWTE